MERQKERKKERKKEREFCEKRYWRGKFLFLLYIYIKDFKRVDMILFVIILLGFWFLFLSNI